VKRLIYYTLILGFCLGLGFFAGVAWAQGGFHLSSHVFSGAATGADALNSEHFQLRVSAAQGGPVGSAMSPHFFLHGGYLQASSAPSLHAFYLPLVVKQ